MKSEIERRRPPARNERVWSRLIKARACLSPLALGSLLAVLGCTTAYAETVTVIGECHPVDRFR
jgi:hypothetical protein